jgi:hypothetical protein
VQQVLMTVNIALRRQLLQLDYFSEGSIPDALIVSGALSPSCSVRSDPEDVAGLDWIGWHIWLTI